jgi:transcriptional regulator with XRE-family HTH domain/predicted RNase H-like HicB family nuclease
MHYVAYIRHERGRILAEFPDCPGCQTFAEREDDVVDMARDALEGWLEANLVDGQIPPRPRAHYGAPDGALARIPVRAGLAAALNIRWARHDAGLSQKALGELARVSQQQIAKLENPDENPSLETLDKVGRALGLQVSVGFEPLEWFQPTPAATFATRASDSRPDRPAHTARTARSSAASRGRSRGDSASAADTTPRDQGSRRGSGARPRRRPERGE